MKKVNILQNPFIVAVLAISASLLWGSAFPVLKISYVELGIEADDIFSKLAFAGLRFFGAGLLLFFIMRIIFKKRLKLDRNRFMWLILLGVLQTTIQYSLFYNGLAHTSGMKSAIIISSANFFVVLFAHFIYKNDKINLKKVLGLVAGFTGVAFANWEQGFGLDFSFKGEGLLLLSTVVAAIGALLAKKISKDTHPFLVSGWQMFLGSLILMGAGIPNIPDGFLKFTPLAVMLLIYSSALSATAFSLWYTVLKHNKAGEVTIYRFMIPVSGTIFSAVFIPNEFLNIRIILALLLVAFGIVIVNYNRKRSTLKN
ncbi:MAG: DMT family transporter [Kosmotogaceae bacterium]